jgi:hypothetical protein
MKNIKDFIYYYRSCPLCKNWITLDVDLPIPTTLEIKDNYLLLTIIDKNGVQGRKYSISFKDNKVESDYPFVFGDVVSTIKRLYLPKYTASIKIEARCYGCSNFRYWSKMMIYNDRTKKLKNIGIGGERVQFHELSQSNEKISYIISNNYNTEETEVFILRSNVKGKALKIKIPFMPFEEIDFNNKNKILDKIKKISVLA